MRRPPPPLAVSPGAAHDDHSAVTAAALTSPHRLTSAGAGWAAPGSSPKGPSAPVRPASAPPVPCQSAVSLPTSAAACNAPASPSLSSPRPPSRLGHMTAGGAAHPWAGEGGRPASPASGDNTPRRSNNQLRRQISGLGSPRQGHPNSSSSSSSSSRPAAAASLMGHGPPPASQRPRRRSVLSLESPASPLSPAGYSIDGAAGNPWSLGGASEHTPHHHHAAGNPWAPAAAAAAGARPRRRSVLGLEMSAAGVHQGQLGDMGDSMYSASPHPGSSRGSVPGAADSAWGDLHSSLSSPAAVAGPSAAYKQRRRSTLGFVANTPPPPPAAGARRISSGGGAAPANKAVARLRTNCATSEPPSARSSAGGAVDIVGTIVSSILDRKEAKRQLVDGRVVVQRMSSDSDTGSEDDAATAAERERAEMHARLVDMGIIRMLEEEEEGVSTPKTRSHRYWKRMSTLVHHRKNQRKQMLHSALKQEVTNLLRDWVEVTLSNNRSVLLDDMDDLGADLLPDIDSVEEQESLDVKRAKRYEQLASQLTTKKKAEQAGMQLANRTLKQELLSRETQYQQESRQLLQKLKQMEVDKEAVSQQLEEALAAEAAAKEQAEAAEAAAQELLAATKAAAQAELAAAAAAAEEATREAAEAAEEAARQAAEAAAQQALDTMDPISLVVQVLERPTADVDESIQAFGSGRLTDASGADSDKLQAAEGDAAKGDLQPTPSDTAAAAAADAVSSAQQALELERDQLLQQLTQLQQQCQDYEQQLATLQPGKQTEPAGTAGSSRVTSARSGRNSISSGSRPASGYNGGPCPHRPASAAVGADLDSARKYAAEGEGGADGQEQGQADGSQTRCSICSASSHAELIEDGSGGPGSKQEYACPACAELLQQVEELQAQVEFLQQRQLQLQHQHDAEQERSRSDSPSPQQDGQEQSDDAETKSEVSADSAAADAGAEGAAPSGVDEGNTEGVEIGKSDIGVQVSASLLYGDGNPEQQQQQQQRQPRASRGYRPSSGMSSSTGAKTRPTSALPHTSSEGAQGAAAAAGAGQAAPGGDRRSSSSTAGMAGTRQAGRPTSGRPGAATSTSAAAAGSTVDEAPESSSSGTAAGSQPGTRPGSARVGAVAAADGPEGSPRLTKPVRGGGFAVHRGRPLSAGFLPSTAEEPGAAEQHTGLPQVFGSRAQSAGPGGRSGALTARPAPIEPITVAPAWIPMTARRAALQKERGRHHQQHQRPSWQQQVLNNLQGISQLRVAPQQAGLLSARQLHGNGYVKPSSPFQDTSGPYSSPHQHHTAGSSTSPPSMLSVRSWSAAPPQQQQQQHLGGDQQFQVTSSSPRMGSRPRSGRPAPVKAMSMSLGTMQVATSSLGTRPAVFTSSIAHSKPVASMPGVVHQSAQQGPASLSATGSRPAVPRLNLSGVLLGQG